MNIPLENVHYIFENLREGEDILSKETIEIHGSKAGKPIVFKDFFTTSDWGNVKELVCYDVIYYNKYDREIETPFVTFKIVHLEPDEEVVAEHLIFNLPDLYVFPIHSTVLWLGKIKNLALIKIGLKAPPHRGERPVFSYVEYQI